MDLELHTDRRDDENHLIPMINIIFLLLVFFMIAGTIRLSSPIDIDNPESAQRQHSSMQRVLYVSRDGALYIAGEMLSLEQLQASLKQAGWLTDPLAIEKNTAAVITVSLDHRMTVKQLRPILAELRSSGIREIEFLTRLLPAVQD